MKRRMTMVALLLAAALTAAGCGESTAESSQNTEDTEDTETTEDASTDEEDASTDSEDAEEDAEDEATTDELMKDVDLDKCVTLGDYKGITVEKSIEAVTDEDIQEEIDTQLAEYPVEVEDASYEAQEGDTVNIDYVGRIDGVEFDGGSATDTDLLLGSDRFIDGFEDGLIDAKKGDTVVLNLTFPDSYSETLAGKDVEFTVTVNAVKQPLEEATDEWVAANLEGYYTVDEWVADIRSEYEENNGETAENQARNSAWMQVVDASTILEYPETLVEHGKQAYYDVIEGYAEYYGVTVEEFVTSQDYTMDDYEANAEEYGKNIAARSMVCYAICKAEGYAVGDEEYETRLQEICDDYGCTSEELIEYNGQDTVEQTILLERVVDLIMDEATVVETEAETDTEEETDTEDEPDAETSDGADTEDGEES